MLLQIFILCLPAVLSQFEFLGMQEGEKHWQDESDPIVALHNEYSERLRSGGRRNARRQFIPMSLQPDMAFGDHNDRFDLNGVYKKHKHKFRAGKEEENGRRSISLPSRRSAQQQPKYRRNEDWLEDLRNDGEDVFGDFDIAAHRAQDYRRHRSQKNNLRSENTDASPKAPKEREIVLKYALPIRIRVQDLVNGTFITGINLL